MEKDIIQKPELIRRLGLRFGLRQAHIAPTLGSTVQPVAIVDDLTTQEVEAFRVASGWAGPSGSAVVPPSTAFVQTALFNPPTSKIIARISFVSISHLTFDGSSNRVPAKIFWSFMPPPVPVTANNPSLWSPGTGYWNNLGRPGGAACSVRHNVQAQVPPNGVVHFNCFLNSGDVYDWRPEKLFLPPDSAVVIGSEEAAVASHTDELWTSWEWIEEPVS